MGHQGAPIVTSNFPSRYQGSHLSLRHHGPPFPPSRHQRNTVKFPKYTMRCRKRVPYLKSYNIDKLCKVWVGVYVGEGSKELRLWSMGPGVWVGAPESPLSMGPERPRYATDVILAMANTNTWLCCSCGIDIICIVHRKSAQASWESQGTWTLHELCVLTVLLIMSEQNIGGLQLYHTLICALRCLTTKIKILS